MDMHDIALIVAIVIGIPVLGGLLIPIIALLRGWWLKARELKLKEEQHRMEERLRTDELNARILRMDDFGISPAEVNSLVEEVRQLRQEVSQLKQEIEISKQQNC